MLEHLQERFEGQAEWRRRKAAEYPHDAGRNLEAAEVFDKLAATCKDVSPEWADAYAKLWADDNDAYRNSEEEQEMMGSIWISNANAEEFIKELVESANERIAAKADNNEE